MYNNIKVIIKYIYRQSRIYSRHTETSRWRGCCVPGEPSRPTYAITPRRSQIWARPPVQERALNSQQYLMGLKDFPKNKVNRPFHLKISHFRKMTDIAFGKFIGTYDFQQIIRNAFSQGTEEKS